MYLRSVPRGLKRYQHARDLHFTTFSCYRRGPLLGTPQACRVFEQTLERVRRWYDFYVVGYVIMPEHVHLLVSEEKAGTQSRMPAAAKAEFHLGRDLPHDTAAAVAVPIVASGGGAVEIAARVKRHVTNRI